jgi:hypothetical protein
MSLKIKPLVWEPVDVGECVEGTGDYYLCHQAGRYWIHRKASGDLRASDGKVSFYDDRDEAKATAQADHEVRIRSALYATPPDQSKRVERLEAALRMLVRRSRTVVGGLAPGQSLKPAGANHTNMFIAAIEEADALLDLAGGDRS